jgi:zinc-ribbon domain
MYCSNCGTQMPDGTRFCRTCGAATQAPVAPVQAPGVPPPPPPAGQGSSKTIWIVLACVGIVVIALAIALPLIFLRGGDGTTQTTLAPDTTIVTAPPTTEATTETTEPTTETTEAATTTSSKPTAGIPGDSAGTWSATNISGIDQQVNEVAVSEDAMVFQTTTELGVSSIFAYLFASGKTVQLPTSSPNAGSVDIDGKLAVWQESEGGDVVTAAHIYAYLLPDGPKVEVTSGAQVTYPQVAGGMITWGESKPWATQPDEYQEWTIKGAAVDEHGQPTGAAGTLVESAIAATTGDSTWTYSLSNGFLAWEQQTSAGSVDAGSYAIDLGEMQPWLIDSEAWRPSMDKNRVVFTRNGIEYSDFAGAAAQQMDSAGDFATAGPTYAAYFRPSPSGDGTAWAVIARGYKGAYEQVLLDDTGDPPWFLPPIATSATHVAFTINGNLYLFTWRGS